MSFLQGAEKAMGGRPMMGKDMTEKDRMAKGEGMELYSSISDKMMKGMMEKSMAAAEGGGVIVMVENVPAEADEK
ncbi:MAG: hypothetical protein Q8Q08_05180 [Candidatus Omnitrophota bacterium]|nr:hypothetical protein [Candidatus Omnitrophota bacterium]